MIKRHSAVIRFHEGADSELTEALRWYALNSLEVARRFLDEIEHGVSMIADGPERWPTHLHGTRRYILRRFPYAIVYRMTNAQLEIVAVTHLHRKPGYWRCR